MPPNILYLHSHDTGRYVQPYGHAIPTPNIQWLADQGVLFRNAFCAAPSCSGSRAALLTGCYCHVNGMMGLAHRGFALNDPDQLLVRTLARRFPCRLLSWSRTPRSPRPTPCEGGPPPPRRAISPTRRRSARTSPPTR